MGTSMLNQTELPTIPHLESGSDDDGLQVWGAEKGGYQFHRK
jgi:hypothetical protein